MKRREKWAMEARNSEAVNYVLEESTATQPCVLGAHCATRYYKAQISTPAYFSAPTSVRKLNPTFQTTTVHSQLPNTHKKKC